MGSGEEGGGGWLMFRGYLLYASCQSCFAFSIVIVVRMMITMIRVT